MTFGPDGMKTMLDLERKPKRAARLSSWTNWAGIVSCLVSVAALVIAIIALLS